MVKLIARDNPFVPWPLPPVDPHTGAGVYRIVELGDGTHSAWVLGDDSWYCQPGMPLEGYAGRTVADAQRRLRELGLIDNDQED